MIDFILLVKKRTCLDGKPYQKANVIRRNVSITVAVYTIPLILVVDVAIANDNIDYARDVE